MEVIRSGGAGGHDAGRSTSPISAFAALPSAGPNCEQTVQTHHWQLPVPVTGKVVASGLPARLLGGVAVMVLFRHSGPRPDRSMASQDQTAGLTLGGSSSEREPRSTPLPGSASPSGVGE